MAESSHQGSWIVCQIGAREDYAVARCLQQSGHFAGLITDAWTHPKSFIAPVAPQRLRERWHEDLADEQVVALTLRSALRNVWDKAAGQTGWKQILARNIWFQKAAARKLTNFPGESQTVFSYSYAAGEIFAEAKRRGWRTVLGQIDPGPVEARLVAKLYEQAGQKHVHQEIPDEYWKQWQREVNLADRIVVNSEWSRKALIEEGVPDEKIAIIPLAYEREVLRAPRQLPHTFSAERPLKLLFLGQVTLRKGIGSVFEAIELLGSVPFQLDIVGPIQVGIPDELQRDPRIHFHGAVPRSETDAFYQQADLFLFPTFSDGFGLTQLEALAAGLPVVASKFCGEVVRDGVNGRVLQSTEASELADIIREIASDPSRLSCLQRNAYVEERFHLDTIGGQYKELMS